MTAIVQVPWPDDVRFLRTGELLVDLCFRRVVCAGSEVELPQRIYDLLLLFLAEPGVLHTRAELFERLWTGVIVEDANLSQSIWLLRKALGKDCRHWVRTVAKAGYVFENPHPIEWLTAPPKPVCIGHVTGEEAHDGPAAIGAQDGDEALPGHAVPSGAGFPIADAPVPAVTTAKPGRSAMRLAGSMRLHHWRRLGAAALVATLAIVAARLWVHPDAASTPPPPHAVPAAAPISAVALIDVHDPAVATQWPVTLLHQWLAWKLGTLPAVTLVTEADIAAGAGSTTPLVVFLTSGNVPDNPGEVLLQARFEQAGRVQRIEVKGPASTVPAMVDALSRQLVSRLLPMYATPWPALAVDAGAARRYADGVESFRRRDWIAAAAIFEEVIGQAPRFGLARLQLAHAQSRLAQASSAVDQMGIARDLLQPAPAGVTAVLDAQRLAIDPQRTQAAAEAYARLAERHPGKSDFVLRHADLRVATGQPERALDILARRDWAREPTETRIAYLLLRSRVHRALGDPQRAREHARTAERMARAAGDGWELERAGAILQIAGASHTLDPQQEGTALYRQAAGLLEAAGDQTGALYARFLVDSAGPPTGPSPRLDELLAKAHAGGYRRLEMDILMRIAMQHHDVGDMDGYRRHLWQAVSVATAAGDVTRRTQLEVLLLNEDVLQGHFAVADERLQRLQSAGLQGMTAVVLDQFAAFLQFVRGHNRHARQSLDRANRRIAAGDRDAAMSSIQAQLACSRAEVLLTQGDLAGARADWKRCRGSASPVNQVIAKLGHAYAELLAGDSLAARDLLRQARAALAPMPECSDRWILVLEVARLLTRLGDIEASDRIYHGLLSALRPTGYRWLVQHARTGLAENAAARGDWDASRKHIARVRRDLPADAWMVDQRLTLLDIATAWADGDRQRAASLAAGLHARAGRLGDALVQMEVHSLLPGASMPDDCDRAHRELLVARSGMRGASLDWLTPALADDDMQLAASFE